MSFRRISTSGKGKRPVSFTFDGKRVAGYEGDTLAAALLASGHMVLGRSFKYHRPRGLFAPGNAEPNALVTLIRGPFREPNIRATEVEIFDGLVAESQNRFPSLRHDVSAMNGLAGKLFSAGFYYKTFMGPGIGPLRSTKFWMLCEKIIRRAAGLGRAGLAPDPDRYDRVNAFCDVLVIGAGEAGRAAAATPPRQACASSSPMQIRHPALPSTACISLPAPLSGASMTAMSMPRPNASPTTNRPARPASRASAIG